MTVRARVLAGHAAPRPERLHQPPAAASRERVPSRARRWPQRLQPERARGAGLVVSAPHPPATAAPALDTSLGRAIQARAPARVPARVLRRAAGRLSTDKLQPRPARWSTRSRPGVCASAPKRLLPARGRSSVPRGGLSGVAGATQQPAPKQAPARRPTRSRPGF